MTTFYPPCSYMSVIHEPREVIRRAREVLRGVEFDTVVGTGISGTLALVPLAMEFGVGFAAVRKPGEAAHSSGQVEGGIGNRWVFVDDFISSGATFARVYKTISAHCRDHSHSTECVGAFLYQDDYEWMKWEKLAKKTGAIRGAVVENDFAARIAESMKCVTDAIF